VNSITVTGYIQEYAQQSDLKTFLQEYRPDLPSNITFALQEIDGGQNLQGNYSAGTEGNLDIQLTVRRIAHAAFVAQLSVCLQAGLVNGIPVTYLSSGATWNLSQGATGQDALLDTINFIANETKKPTVVSTSYGQDEYTCVAQPRFFCSTQCLMSATAARAQRR
jgi:tripeptidyl-peptidase-1